MTFSSLYVDHTSWPGSSKGPERGPDRGSGLIVDGIVRRPKRVAIPAGNLFEFAYGVAPKAVERVLNAAYQLYPESGDQSDQQAPVSRDAAVFQRVFKAVTRRARRRSAGRE